MSEPTTPQGPQGPTNRPQGATPGQVPAAGHADQTASTPPGPPTAPLPAAPAASSGLPPKHPGLWRQATASTGGIVAVVVAASLAALLLAGIVGVGLFAGARMIAHNIREDRIEQVRENREGQLPPGMHKKLERQGPRQGVPDGRGGSGLGPMMRDAEVLGSVQHGEFTVQGSDGKATTMTVQRGTVTVASATSVTVKSDDGFTATYAVDDSTRGKAGTVAKGDRVLVIAQKTGAKAVLIRAVRTK